MSEIHKFLFDGLPLKGAIVQLRGSWQEVLRRRAGNTQTGPYPLPVAELLGEMLAAACLMQSSIKFNGALVLQMRGEGPVQLAVAEVQADMALRATATLKGEVGAGAQLTELVNAHGAGRCAVTLDPRDRLPGQQPYQGVVGLNNADGQAIATLAQCLQSYMQQSEQLQTHFVLAANSEVATGIMIQRLPLAGSANLQSSSALTEDELEEACTRIFSHTASLKSTELLGLNSDTILHRLFWEEKLLRFTPTDKDNHPHFTCTCNRTRVGNMLRNLGQAEAQDILQEQGQIEIGCDFCGAQYRFDAVDVGTLFSAVQTGPWPNTIQ